LKQFDKSIATNRQALQVAPHSLNPLVNIAKTYKVINEPDSALYYFEQALLIQPNDPNIRAAIEQLKKK
jgi:tetratricopeptide (TPR) repeat protein